MEEEICSLFELYAATHACCVTSTLITRNRSVACMRVICTRVNEVE